MTKSTRCPLFVRSLIAVFGPSTASIYPAICCRSIRLHLRCPTRPLGQCMVHHLLKGFSYPNGGRPATERGGEESHTRKIRRVWLAIACHIRERTGQIHVIQARADFDTQTAPKSLRFGRLDRVVDHEGWIGTGFAVEQLRGQRPSFRLS